MTRREQVLIGLMCVSLVAGGVLYLNPSFLAGGKGLVRNPVQEAQTTAAEISAGLQQLPLSPAQRAVLEAARQPALKNPFADPPGEALARSGGGAGSLAPGVAYTGYVQVGKEALAIIGGLEYMVGDVLPESGDVIRAIRESGVTLYSPARKTEWELPYSGDDM